MRRRELMLLLGTVMTMGPTLRAQEKAMPVIGWLSIGSPGSDRAIRLTAFHQGLNETGYVENQNVASEYRWAEGQYDRLPALADDLVRRQVAVIFAVGGTPSDVRPRRRLRQFRSSSTSALIRFNPTSSPAWPGRAVT